MAPCLKLGPFEGKELFQEDVDFKVQRLQSSKKRNLSNQKLANPVAEIVVHIHSSSTYPWSYTSEMERTNLWKIERSWLEGDTLRIQRRGESRKTERQLQCRGADFDVR